MEDEPSAKKLKRSQDDDDPDFDGEGLEGIDLEDEEEMGSKTIQVGDKNFTFSFAWMFGDPPEKIEFIVSFNVNIRVLLLELNTTVVKPSK